MQRQSGCIKDYEREFQILVKKSRVELLQISIGTEIDNQWLTSKELVRVGIVSIVDIYIIIITFFK